MLLLRKRFPKSEIKMGDIIMVKTIQVDFDGVLNNYVGNYDENNLPSLKEGADEFIKELAKIYKIEVFTVRNKIKTVKWLEKNNLLDYIYDVTSVKNPYTSSFLDYRAINFDGDFNKALEKIKSFEPYWKIR